MAWVRARVRVRIKVRVRVRVRVRVTDALAQVGERLLLREVLEVR